MKYRNFKYKVKVWCVVSQYNHAIPYPTKEQAMLEMRKANERNHRNRTKWCYHLDKIKILTNDKRYENS